MHFPTPSHPPYRGGYRPGRGPGREPPPRQREPYWPSYKAPAQEREFSWQEPGGGAGQGCQSQTCTPPASRHTPLSSLPHPSRASGAPPPPPWAGAVVAIPPARAQARGRPVPAMPPPALSHTPYRGDIARGGARGGNHLPGKENHAGPSIRLPPRSGGSRDEGPGEAWPGGGDLESSRGKSPGGAQTREGDPVHLSPAPPGKGAARKVGPDHILPQRLVIKVKSGAGGQALLAPSSP